MKIPLVINFKWLHTIANRVLWEFVVFCHPVWVYRPIRFEIATDPVKEFLTRRAFRNFHSIVNTHHASAGIYRRLHFIELWIDRMPTTSVGVHYNTISIRECIWCIRPAVFVHDNVVVGQGGPEAVCKNHATSVVLM